jgi:putative Mg2+ transporter-C (MgtC) family protein
MNASVPDWLPHASWNCISPLRFWIEANLGSGMGTPVDNLDIFLRLLAATAAGMAIGINRDLRGKPTGVRTLGLVSLGAGMISLATITLPSIADAPDALSRVVQGIIQGVLTGIGFVGAGVVLRNPEVQEVHGLTTAASVWVTASLGVACALASWSVVSIGIALTLGLLFIGHPLDVLAARHAPRYRGHDDDPPDDTAKQKRRKT